MIPKSNFHTHTTYCDGASTAEETVKSAIQKGFTAIGFSGHAYMTMDDSFCMTREGTTSYREEILSLKEQYKDRIAIFCGLELDYYSELDARPWDFLIGSVHCIKKGDVYYSVDDTESNFTDAVKNVWNGDFYSLAEEYFALVSDVIQKTNADIIGHIDLVTKFNEGEKLFSESHPRYVNAWKQAVDKLILTGKPFEINTGAMQRGYRSAPYPSLPILKYIKEQGGKIVINSDCHLASAVDYGYDVAVSLAKSAGFTSSLELGRDMKWKEVSL